MKLLAKILLAVFLAGALVAGCVALVNDEDALGPIQFAGHEYDDGCWEGECYDGRYGDSYGGGGQDQWNNEDRNRNRNRNRGAFSPGPFDRSPIEMRDVCISLDCSGRERRQGEPPPEEMR